MTISTIKKDVKNFFSDLDNMAKEKPLVTLTYALALTIFSVFITPYSLIIAIGIFSLSLPFHLITIKNFKGMYQNLEEKVKDIFTGDPREKSQVLGNKVKILAHQIFYRTIGFFEGLFSKNKDDIV